MQPPSDLGVLLTCSDLVWVTNIVFQLIGVYWKCVDDGGDWSTGVCADGNRSVSILSVHLNRSSTDPYGTMLIRCCFNITYTSS